MKENNFNLTVEVYIDGQLQYNELVVVTTTAQKATGKHDGVKNRIKQKYSVKHPNSRVEARIQNETLVQ